LRERPAPRDLLALVPQLGRELDPLLTQLDRLLDDDGVFPKVKADLARRYPRTLPHGRLSPPVDVILRMIAVRRLDRGSDAATEHFGGDSLVVRQFGRVSRAAVPDDPPRIRWANGIGPRTSAPVTERGVGLARALQVTRGRKRRTESTVGETTIPHPTARRILGDGVRVRSRLLQRAQGVIPDGTELAGGVFRGRTRGVRRLAQEGQRVARRKGEEAAEGLKDV
jgi:IS5 family transposase